MVIRTTILNSEGPRLAPLGLWAPLGQVMLQENTQHNAWALLRHNEPRGRDGRELTVDRQGHPPRTENFWLREKAIRAITESIQLKDENR